MMDIKAIGYEGPNWIHVAQDIVESRTPVNMVMNLPTPQKEGNSLRRLFNKDSGL
jgi:hypothetical protein